MIRNIFIPEYIGSYYLTAKHIIGLDINRKAIYATVISAKGYKRTIEKFIEEPLEYDTTVTYEERITRALLSIFSKIGPYDYVYTSISSSSVIFKEITLPFTGIKKIKLVMPFEVEALLPFSLDTALLDAIITKTNTQESKTDILVAAVKKDFMQHYLHMFTQAQVGVDKVSVDMFELYGLYTSIPAYQNSQDTQALIDIGMHTTRLAILVHGQLKYIRALPKGIITIAKELHNNLSIDTAQALEEFIRFGPTQTENSDFALAAQNATQDLLADIQFTFTSYSSKLKTDDSLKKIILTGVAADIPDMASFMANTLAIPTHVLAANKIIHNGIIDSKMTTIPQSFLVSLATALSSPVTQDFNLQRLEANQQEDKTLQLQLITLGILSMLLILSFLTYSFLRVRSLRKAYNTSQALALDKLKKTFDLPSRSLISLKKANTDAAAKLESAEKKWSPLSHKNRFSFLNYLYELSRHIDRKDLGLDLSSISMDQDEITLTGRVKDFDAVRTLEQELRSELFSLEDSLQVPEFQTRPIKLRINKNYRSP